MARLFAVLCFGIAAHGARVTPMEKVITLLTSLSEKVAAEGAKEAAEYDKFACFCKEQADEKLYSIEKSTAKIEDLSAEIKELDSAIVLLNGQVSTLSKDISKLDGSIKRKTAKRKTERAEYEAKAKDMNEAIDACDAAIDALTDSKSAMSGAKVDLAQVRKVADVVSKKPDLASTPAAVALISAVGAPKFEYQSNDIIATLDKLLASFKKMKKALDFQETDINSAFESARLGLQNEKKFAEKERAEKEAVVEAKTETMEAAKEDRTEENKDKDADDSFMNEITKQCEETAMLFDQRSKTRSEELTALSEATAELKKGAVPNFSANKKLVGFQQKSVVSKAKIVVDAPSFVQISSVQDKHAQAAQAVVIKKVYDLLHEKASLSRSTALAAVSMRIKMAEDHFVKVRLLIKDLLAKLKDDAKSELTQKRMCDKEMKKAIDDRDKANADIEVATAKITTLTAKKNELVEKIATLQSEISDLQKALLERTELRSDEEAENLKTMSMSKEAIASVKLALGLLQDFYNKALLVQTSSKYTPPKSDRDGNTVGDLAPDVFGDKYHGSQSESKGIVGILEVILSDFQRTNTGASDDEKESKTTFEKFETDTKKDIGTKQASIKKADGEVANAESDILDQEKDLSDGNELLESSQKALEDLKNMCVAGEETWEERKKKREEEIDALKEALAIFEDWQK